MAGYCYSVGFLWFLEVFIIFIILFFCCFGMSVGVSGYLEGSGSFLFCFGSFVLLLSFCFVI